MCDFISYEIKERYGKKRLLEDEELEQKPELEKVQEQPITITQ